MPQTPTSGNGPMAVLRFLYHLPKMINLVFRLLGDPRVPFLVKLLPYAALAYFIFPIDLFRDFPFPYIGYLDDVLVVSFLLKMFIQLSPQDVVREHADRIGKKEDA